MDFIRVDILSGSSGTLGVINFPALAPVSDGQFEPDGEIVFGSSGTRLTLNQPISDYLWVELVYAGLGAQLGTVNVAVYSVDNNPVPSVQGIIPIEQGHNSEAVYKVPYIGTIQEIGMQLSGGVAWPGAGLPTAILKAIRVIKSSDNFTRIPAIPAGRALIAGGGFVQQADGSYMADILSGAAVFPNITFYALAEGSEVGVIRVEFIGANGALCEIGTLVDGVQNNVFAPKSTYVYSASPLLNVFPTILQFINLGPTTSRAKIYVELGRFLDQNISAFGINAQPTGAPPSLYNPLQAFIGLTGWIYVAAGVATGFPQIPANAIDFTPVIPVINATTLNVVNLNVTGNSNFNDLKVTRTGVPGVQGSIYFRDVGGYVTPSLNSTFNYRSDLGTAALGLGVNAVDMTLLNLDASATGTGSVNFRQGIKLFSRPISVADIAINGFITDLNAANAIYVLPALTHFSATATLAAAPATITTVKGFAANNTITRGTNNYGFWSDIINAATTLQLYMSGSAQSIFNGTVNFGNANVGGTTNALRFGTVSTNTAADIWSCYGLPTFPSTTVTTAGVFVSEPSTAAAAFTVPSLIHYWAKTTTKGATSSITNIYGFLVSNTMVVAGSNNYGFNSEISAASNTYQLRMNGSAQSRFNGPVGFFTDPSTSTFIHANVGGLSAASSVAYYVAGAFVSTVTGTGLGFQAQLQSAAAAVTYAEITGFRVDTWVKGATSTITVGSGFRVEDSFAVASTNYGFLSNINSGAGKYQLRMAGTAMSRFDGPVGFFTDPAATTIQHLSCAGVSGTTSAAIYIGGLFPATVLTNGYGIQVQLGTTAAAVTYAELTAFRVDTWVKNAGSTITIAAAFRVEDSFALGNQSYGFLSNILSGANKYQFFAGGTALNSFKGGMILDTTAAPTVAAGQIGLGATVATTVGAAGAASALPATPLGYLIMNVAGTQVKVPYYNN